MKVPHADTRCILCAIEADHTDLRHLTEEHIIPEAIGGVLTSNFLCKPCNDLLGAHESKLKEDPSWRLALQRIKDRIPWLWETTSKRQLFVGQSDRGPVDGYYRKQGTGDDLDFRVKTVKYFDGSLVCPSDDARISLSKMLHKENLTSVQVEDALQKYDLAPENTRITIAPGFDVVKWKVTRVDPKLDGRLLVVHLTPEGKEVLKGAGITLLKIAFEYVALHLGSEIFDPRFDSIRQALRNNDCSLAPHHVEWNRGPTLQPFYGLLVERAPTYIVVQIRFFGELVYRVHFPHLIPGPSFSRCKYTHDLITGTEHLEEA